MIITGAEILVQSLIDHKVKSVFGYPGGTVLNIYDTLYRYKDKINHILTAHEQGAAHAADGYARATGKVGVCIATSGPGATNLVTGIATAYMDSVPVVIITGNVNRSLLGTDSFQEVDIAGITMPITKHNYIVKDINELQDIVREAFYIAASGRPGPVLIDIPSDVTTEKIEYVYRSPIRVEREVSHIKEKSIEVAAKLINESKCPFIYAGGGVISAEASKDLLEFAKLINAPTSVSLMGLGAYPCDDELFTGMIGMHGTYVSNILATKCDLFICIGARFSNRVINSRSHIKNAKIIHIDIDPAEINKNIKCDSYIVGDVREVLERLKKLVEAKQNSKWIEQIEELRKKKSIINRKNIVDKIFDKLNELSKDEYIIATDVGQHQMWTATKYNFNRPRSIITSGGLGTMGFGVGASIGAQIGMKDKKVILITGDGSFGMNCNEVVTMVSQGLPIKVLVMNNNALGMVRQWQDLFYNKRFSETTLNRSTDFVKLAEAFGSSGYRISSGEDIESILEEALKSEGSAIIDCLIDDNEKVFPMVPAGQSLENIICEDINEEEQEEENDE